MRLIGTNEPTRYEIIATHQDGRKFLVSYAGGSPSRYRLLSAMQSHGDALIEKLAVGETDQITFGTKPRPFAKVCGWTIAYTGRTQREVRTLGTAHPFIMEAAA